MLVCDMCSQRRARTYKSNASPLSCRCRVVCSCRWSAYAVALCSFSARCGLWALSCGWLVCLGVGVWFLVCLGFAFVCEYCLGFVFPCGGGLVLGW